MDAFQEPGHLFAVHGDLTKLALDDIVIPCDGRLNVTAGFRSVLGEIRAGDGDWIRPVGHEPPDGFDGSDRAPLLLHEHAGEPRAWLFNSSISDGVSTEAALEWLTTGIESLLITIASRERQPLYGRSRRTIGMPMVGVGEGGFKQIRADVIKALLEKLASLCQRPGFPDVVVVAWERSDYSALQAHRPPPDLPRSTRNEEITRLADLALTNGLVAFLGAGVGQSAGLPGWHDLLQRLAGATTWDPAVRAAVLALDPEDAAEALERELGITTLRGLIVEQISSRRSGLSHGLIAGMRLGEVVTTNYDDLFESASERPQVGRLAVLPRQRLEAGRPWLLKLHGDVAVPKSIVLTRSQYFAFDTRSVPLAAVVQSQMVTKHLLFIGYSLNDVNFIRLAHQVRELFERFETDPRDRAPVGTVVTLGPRPADQILWEGDLRYLAVDTNGEEGSRQVEILLDCIAQRACDESQYLLDSRYANLLHEADADLANGLNAVRVSASRSAPTAAWERMRSVLREFGERDDH